MVESGRGVGTRAGVTVGTGTCVGNGGAGTVVGSLVGVGNMSGGLGVGVPVGVAVIGRGVLVGAMVAMAGIASLGGTGVGVDGVIGACSGSTSSSPRKLGVGVGVGGTGVDVVGTGVWPGSNSAVGAGTASVGSGVGVGDAVRPPIAKREKPGVAARNSWIPPTAPRCSVGRASHRSLNLKRRITEVLN